MPQKPQPQLDQERTKELNLTVLQRIDPAVEEILITAGHVTLYELDVEENSWGRKDVEGSLFVVKRREQPRFQFIVMNRRSTENLVEDLLGDVVFEVQVPYLLYRNAQQEVNGIWFYNQRECEETAKLFTRILNAFSKTPPKGSLLPQPSSEFQELEAVPTQAIVDGPLEPAAPPVEEAQEPTFFGSSMQAGQPLEPARNSLPKASTAQFAPLYSTQSPRSPATRAPLALSGLMSMPPSASAVNVDLSSDLSTLGLHQSSSNPMLLKPDFFASLLPPPAQPAPPSNPTGMPHGAPLLQPFPPPLGVSPPPPPTPDTTRPEVLVTRDGVRKALLRLLQDDHFIDMIFEELAAEKLGR